MRKAIKILMSVAVLLTLVWIGIFAYAVITQGIQPEKDQNVVIENNTITITPSAAESRFNLNDKIKSYISNLSEITINGKVQKVRNGILDYDYEVGVDDTNFTITVNNKFFDNKTYNVVVKKDNFVSLYSGDKVIATIPKLKGSPITSNIIANVFTKYVWYKDKNLSEKITQDELQEFKTPDVFGVLKDDLIVISYDLTSAGSYPDNTDRETYILKDRTLDSQNVKLFTPTAAKDYKFDKWVIQNIETAGFVVNEIPVDGSTKFTKDTVLTAKYTSTLPNMVNYTVKYVTADHKPLQTLDLPTIVETNRIGTDVTINHLEAPGYKILQNQPTTHKLIDGENIIEVVYEVDKSQTQFKAFINLYIENTINQVPGLDKQIVLNGYLGQVVTFTHPTTDRGYKVLENQPVDVVIFSGNTSSKDVYYTIDETQFVNVNFAHDAKSQLTGKTQFKILKSLTIEEQITALPKITYTPGYKSSVDVYSPKLNLNEKLLSNATYTSESIVDTDYNKFQYVYKYLVKDTQLPVDGIDNFKVVGYGYIGEVINVDEILVTTGYKPVDTQTYTLTVLEDNTAELIVNYEIDKTQLFDVEVTYVIDGSSSLVPEMKVFKVKGYLGQEVTIPANNLNGYKVLDTETTTFVVTNDAEKNKKSLNYVVDESQSSFTASIKYYIKDTTTPVPGLSNTQVNGYVGQEVSIPKPVNTLGYKAVLGQVANITIKYDNSATIDIFYEKDDTQFSTLTIRSGKGYDVVGGDYSVEVLNTIPLNDPLQPNKVTLPTIEPKPGYKLDTPAFVPNLDLSQNFTQTLDVKPNVIVDTQQRIFILTIKYYIEGTTTPVPGVEKPTHIEKGYLGENVLIPFPETDKGYKLIDNPPTAKVVTEDNSAVAIIYYVVDKSQLFDYQINYYIKDTNKPVPYMLTTQIENIETINGKGYVGQEISIPTPQSTYGYKLVEGQQTQFLVNYEVLNNNKNIFYEIDESQNTFTANYVYNILGSNLPVPGVVSSQVTGYVGQKIELNSPNMSQGYRLVGGQDDFVVIKHDNSASITIFYEKDNTKFSTLTIREGENYTIQDGEYKVEVLNDIPLNDPQQPNKVILPTITPNKGYKLGTPAFSPEIDITKPFESSQIIKPNILVDKEQSDFTYTYRYLIENTQTPVPGITNHTVTATGYIGQVIEIPQLTTNKGYIIKPGQDLNLIVREDNTASRDVYYIVDENQVFSYQINYYIKSTTNPVPQSSSQNISNVSSTASVGQTIMITKPNAYGYSVIGNQITSFVNTNDETKNIYNIYYDIDKTQTTFRGVINYYIDNTQTPVPSFSTVEVTGYVGQKISINKPVNELGYKVKPNQADTLTIKLDNTASIYIYYIEDSDQFAEFTIPQGDTYTLSTGPSYSVKVLKNYPLNDSRQPVKVVIPSVIPNPGYKLGTPVFSPSINLNTNISQPQQFIPNILIDETQMIFDYNYKILIENTNTFVPGIAIANVFGKGYIGQVVNIIAPVVTTGYKVKEGQELSVTVKEDNTASKNIYYVVDSNQTFKYEINHYIINTKDPVPATETTVVNKISGSLILGERLNINAASAYGYKAIDNYPKYILGSNILEDNIVNIYYEVDQTQTQFQRSIIYRLYDVATSNVTGVPVISQNSYVESGYIGQEFTITPPQVPNYVLQSGQKLDYKIEITNKPILIYYEADSNSMTTLVIPSGDKYTLSGSNVDSSGQFKVNVFKNLPLNALNQVKFSLPVVNVTAHGYRLGFPIFLGFDMYDTISNASNIRVNIVVDETVTDFQYTYNFELSQNNMPVPGIANHTVTGTGYIGQVITITPEPAVGYSPVAGQNFELTILDNNTASKTIYYEIDQSQTFEYTINYSIKDSNKAVPLTINSFITTINQSAPVSTEIVIDHPQALGYKVVDNQPTKLVVSTNPSQNIVDVYYEVDTLQANFTATVYYLLEDETPVPGLNSQTITGYAEQEHSIISPTSDRGYKVMPNQVTTIKTEYTNATSVKIYYEKDQTQWSTLTIEEDNNYTIMGGRYEVELLNTMPISDPRQPNNVVLPNIEPKYGYKVDETNPWTPQLDMSTQLYTTQTFKPNIVVDQSVNTFTYTVYYYIKNTQTPVPGIDSPVFTGSGYAGQVVFAPAASSTAGYRVVAGQTTLLTVTDDNLASKIYYYEIDPNVLFPYEIRYRIQYTSNLVPQTTNTNIEDIVASAPVETQITINHPSALGYKVVDNQPTSLKVSANAQPDIVYVYYEVDQGQNQFSANINYYIKDTTNPVPTITNKVVNGYVGQDINIDKPLNSQGYKVVEGQDDVIKIKYDNSATIDIFYEKDETQWIVVSFVKNENSNVSQQRFDMLKAYSLDNAIQPTKVVEPEITPNKGYKVDSQKWLPQLDLSQVLSSNQEYVANVVVDQTQKDFTYTYKYVLENSQDPVPGIQTQTVSGKGYISQVVDVDIPVLNTGYVVKDSQVRQITVQENNLAYLEVEYVVDKTQLFTYSINYYIENSLSKVPTSETDFIQNISGQGYVGQNIQIPKPQALGYIARQGQLNEFNISYFESNNSYTIYYVIDQSQNNFRATVNYYIEGSTNFVPGLDIQTTTHVGYVGQEFTIQTPETNLGYKIMSNQTNSLSISYTNQIINIYYEKDLTKWTTLTITGADKYTMDTYSVEVLNTIALNDPQQPNEVILPSIQPRHGYKQDDTNPWTPQIDLTKPYTSSDAVTANIIVDKSVRDFDYAYNFRLTTSNSYRLNEYPDVSGKGYIGEVIDIEYLHTITGFKVVPNQASNITVLEDNSARETIYFEVDRAQTFAYTIVYHIKGSIDPIPGLENINVSQRANALTEVYIQTPTVRGFKPVSTTPDSFVVQIDEMQNKIVVEYEINERDLAHVLLSAGSDGVFADGEYNKRFRVIPGQKLNYKHQPEPKITDLDVTLIDSVNTRISKLGKWDKDLNLNNVLYVNTTYNVQYDRLRTVSFYESKLRIKQMASGNEFNIFIDQDNKLYGYGSNEYGQLGLNSTKSYFDTPTLIPTDFTPLKVYAGRETAYVISTDGKLYVAGLNNLGQLGLGNRVNRARFVESKLPNNEIPYQVAHAHRHTIVLTLDNNLYGAGANNHGQLGMHNNISNPNPSLTWSRIDKNTSETIIKVAVGGDSSVFLTQQGNLYTFGYNSDGQLLAWPGDRPSPTKANLLGSISKPIDVVMGQYHMMFLTDENKAYATGRNDHGQIDYGLYSYVSDWVEIPTDEKVVEMYAVINSSAVLTDKGNLYVFGDNHLNQLGNPNFANSNIKQTPIKINQFLDNKKVSKMSMGGRFSAFLTTDGEYYVSGENAKGQFGNGNTNGSIRPVNVFMRQGYKQGEQKVFDNDTINLTSAILAPTGYTISDKYSDEKLTQKLNNVITINKDINVYFKLETE